MSDFIFGQPPPPPSQNSNSSGSSNNNQNTNQNKRKPNSTGVLRKKNSNDVRHHPYRNGLSANQPSKQQLPKTIPSLPNTPLVKANAITDVNDSYNSNRYPVQQQQKPTTNTINIRSPADVIADLQRGLLNKAAMGNQNTKQNNRQNNNNNNGNNNGNANGNPSVSKQKKKKKNKNKAKQATNSQTVKQKNEQKQKQEITQHQQQQLPQPQITAQPDTSMQSDNNETLELFPGIRIEIPHPANDELEINSDITTEAPVIDNIQVGEKSDPAPVPGSAVAGGDDMDIDAVTEDFEDEERAFGKQAVSIPGTNIVLETEEDIQKWIEERKQNWPTKKRMEEKQKEKEENDKILKSLSSQNNKTSRSNYEPANGLTDNDQTKRNVRICKFFASTGKCRKGNLCKFSHVVSNDPSNQNNKNLESEDVNRRRNFVKLPNHKTCILHGVPVQIPQRFTPSLNKGKSLHNLMIESEIMQSENNKILSILEKIVNSNLISNDWDTLKKKLNL